MPRLTTDQWALARVDFELHGMSVTEIGKKFGVSQQAVSKKAQSEGWEKSCGCELVEQKVDAVRSFAKAEKESCAKGTIYNHAINDAVSSKLREEGLLTSLACILAEKARSFAENVESISDLESLSRVKKNLTPPGSQTNVTVQQAQASSVVMSRSPEDVCDELIAAIDKENLRGG